MRIALIAVGVVLLMITSLVIAVVVMIRRKLRRPGPAWTAPRDRSEAQRRWHDTRRWEQRGDMTGEFPRLRAADEADEGR